MVPADDIWSSQATRRCRLKIAVAGAGVMGRNHIRVCSELEGLEVVGVVESNAEAAARIARLFRVRTFETVSRLLGEAKPDILIVATPTSTHFAVAREAIAAGVHVLIEKPIAATVAEGRELVALAAGAGVKLGVGHIERFNPAVRELKKHLDEGELGRVYQIVARRIGPFPPRIHDVGVIVDLATHDVNIMEHVVGSTIERVFAETARRIHQSHEDLVSCAMRFESGTVGVIDINWLTPTKIRELSVIGERGMFVVELPDAGSDAVRKRVVRGRGRDVRRDGRRRGADDPFSGAAVRAAEGGDPVVRGRRARRREAARRRRGGGARAVPRPPDRPLGARRNSAEGESRKGHPDVSTPAARSRIPIAAVDREYASLRADVLGAVTSVFDGCRFILGPEVEAFEKDVGGYLGGAHAIGCANGTDALVLALRAIDVGPGDEVIVPAFTFAATAEAVALVGATPVFADIDPDTFAIDPRSAADLVGKHTRALLLVHLFGHCARMEPLWELAERAGVKIVEDAAQAIGAKWRGKAAGTLGHVAGFSFYPTKNLGDRATAAW